MSTEPHYLQNQHVCVTGCEDRHFAGNQLVCTINGKTIQENASADDCPHPTGRQFPSRGIGDTVAKVLQKVTGKAPCGGCAERQKKLNDAMPYKRD